jgi:hypothetical protein
MGIEFSLKKENERFDLDKGGWETLGLPRGVEFKIPEFFTELDLTQALRDKVYPNNKYLDDVYYTEIANRIFKWCGDQNVTLIVDSLDEEYFDIPVTEDRFVPRLFKKEKQDDTA